MIKYIFCSFFVLVLATQNTFSQTLIAVSDSVFKHPESAVFDPECDCFYVSNMDKDTPEDSLHTDFISKVDFSGNPIELKWLTGLSSPTGLAMYNNLLYAVERNGVAVIDPKQKKIVDRYPIPKTGFLNDITISEKGKIYVSETSLEGKIYQIEDGKVSIFMQDTAIEFTNGLLLRGEYLFAGINGDYHLKRIHVPTKTIEKMSFLGPGNLDGIQAFGENLLVSHFMGNLYLINMKGEVRELINTREKNIFIADFAYHEDSRSLIIPSLRTHRIYVYRFQD